ncbi:MAG: Smr/MutS family protein [Mariprofundaceae bacterium]
MSDDDLFGKAMSKVKPLAQTNKVMPARQSRGASQKGVRRAENTVHHARVSGSAALLQTDEPWVLKTDGISHERLKQLAAGRPPAGSTLDMHGMSREEALQAMESCMAEALSQGERALCFVHGRGLHSQGSPVLKEAVYHWLREGPYAGHVLAVIPKPGTGGGSCLVLLRRQGKSP